MLSCFGARCWTSTKAIPVLAGRFRRSWVKASNPPAEAPMPTIGKDLAPGRSFADAPAGGIVFGLGLEGVAPKSFFAPPERIFRGDFAVTREGLAGLENDEVAFDFFFPAPGFFFPFTSLSPPLNRPGFLCLKSTYDSEKSSRFQPGFSRSKPKRPRPIGKGSGDNLGRAGAAEPAEGDGRPGRDRRGRFFGADRGKLKIGHGLSLGLW